MTFKNPITEQFDQSMLLFWAAYEATVENAGGIDPTLYKIIPLAADYLHRKELYNSPALIANLDRKAEAL